MEKFGKVFNLYKKKIVYIYSILKWQLIVHCAAPSESLEINFKVSSALVEIVRRITKRPRYILAKVLYTFKGQCALFLPSSFLLWKLFIAGLFLSFICLFLCICHFIKLGGWSPNLLCPNKTHIQHLIIEAKFRRT